MRDAGYFRQPRSLANHSIKNGASKTLVLVLISALCALVIGGVVSAEEHSLIIDEMESTSNWSIFVGIVDGRWSSANISTIPGKDGKALEISYNLKDNGWISISRSIDPDTLLEIDGISFDYWGDGNPNTLEFKLVYEDGTNYGKQWHNATSMKDWKTLNVSLVPNELECWFPKENCEKYGELNLSLVRWMEFAVSDKGTDIGDKGGAGRIIIDNVRKKIPPPPPTTGSILASSTPSGAEVYLDGAPRGITPVTISDVSAGPHTLEFRKSGYKTYSGNVVAKAGDTVTISPHLELIPASPLPTKVPETPPPTPPRVILLVALVVVAAGGAILLWRRREALPDLSDLYDLEYLSEGGFSVVKKAKRKRDGEIVALKLPKAVTREGLNIFLQEIGVWRLLRDCENVVRLNKVGLAKVNDTVQPYIEMELGECNLREKIPLDAEKACTIMFEILNGLAFAHSSNILHKDLKPENILFVKGRAKISDFGLSKLKSSKYSKDYSGTVHYSAPEQFSSKRFGRVDKRTDVYQIGVVFYEILTGRLPFEGEDNVAYMQAVINEKPKSLKEDNVPQELEKIVMKCLSKEKEERYEDAKDLRDALGRYLKVGYTSGLEESERTGNMGDSVRFCCELFLLNLTLDDHTEALKYGFELKEKYAKGDDKAELENMLEELEYRRKEQVPIGEEFLERAKVLVHKIQMGWK